MADTQQIMWLDLETTGLDPMKNGIIEVAAVFQYPNRNQVHKRFERQVDPRKGRNGVTREVEIHPKALETNGITIEEIGQFGDIDTVMMELDSYVEPWCMIGGWNVAGFDIGFLKAAYERAGLKWRFHFHTMDMMIVANYLRFCGKLNTRSLALQNVAKYLCIDTAEFGPAHRAMPDVWTTLAITKRFREDFMGGMQVKF